jgi:hypothetical protein
MKKIEVLYQSGESRENPGVGVDYMLAKIEDEEILAELGAEEEIELYAEDGSYEELKEEIIEQAREYGIAEVQLKFWYDE